MVTFPSGARLEIWPEQQHCRTVFPDGLDVPASPHETDEYRQRARSLGYGGTDAQAAWRMCAEHEWAHNALAGQEFSPTLRAVATGQPADQPEHWAEEARVMEFQRGLNAWRIALWVST